MSHVESENRGETPAPGFYVLDAARSNATFTTRHFFGLGAVRGSFSLTEGQVRVGERPGESSVTAYFSSGSFETGNVKRDNIVRSAAYLDSAAHPQIVFSSEILEPKGAGHVLKGSVTVKDVTKPVEVAFGAPVKTAAGWQFEATTRIDRYAFGLTAQKGMAGRHLNLLFTVVMSMSA